MAAVSTTNLTRNRGNIWTVASGTAQADTGQTTYFNVPDWARYATFWLDVTATAGTTPLTDFKLVALDPITLDSSYQNDFAGWNGITQIAGTTSGSVVVYVGPGITGIADDDTGPIYAINAPLPPVLGAVITLDRTSSNETYTYTLRVKWSK